MTAPLDALLELDAVDWKPAPFTGDASSNLPYATHAGVLQIGGMPLRCYRLNTGVAVFDTGDVERFFGGLIGE